MAAVEEQVPLTDDESFVLLYRFFLFLVCLYILGDILCQRGFRIVPALVGQIFVGLLFGSNGANWFLDQNLDWLSIAGQLGLVLMLCQAGCQMDLKLLEETGLRSVLMAVTGSLLPTCIGFLWAYFLVLEDRNDWKGALSVGASFGPTSAGIALSVLEKCGVLQTPVGQVVVAVAIVDDILALVILSQLRVLTADELSPSQIVVPIISALMWLLLGTFVARKVMPMVLNQMDSLRESFLQKVEKQRCDRLKSEDTAHGLSMENEESKHEIFDFDERIEISSEVEIEEHRLVGDQQQIGNNLHFVGYATILLCILLPATYYSEASFFLGAFLAGLCLATRTAEASEAIENSWSTAIEWLMRLFFGATIAFVIPVNLWIEKPETSLVYGLALSTSLLGKVLVGPMLTPIFPPDVSHRWDSRHWKDCMIVGCSMAGEAEFAFVVAKFGFEEGLMSDDVYASVTFAILLSTIISPVMLRIVLARSSESAS